VGLRLQRAAFFLAGIVLIILPVTMRNLYVGSQFVLITSGGGEVFYIGNNPKADGTYIEPEFVRPTTKFEHEDFRKKAKELTGRELSRKESSDFWYSEGFKFIFENPLGYARLLKKKMVFFWNFYEFPDNQNYYFQRTRSSVLGWPLAHFGIIAPLGLMGIFLSLRHPGRFSVLHLVFLTYMVSVLIFFNFSRFRLPAVPFLIVFGMYAVSWIVKNLLEKRLRPLFLCLPVLAILYVGVNHNALGKDPYRHEFDTAYTGMGHCYATAGRTEEAYGFYEKALEITPNYPGALYGVGSFYYQRGRMDLAEKAYRDAIEANTYYSEGHYGLGTVLFKRGELDSALHELERAVELDPWRASYRVNLGFVLDAKGRYPGALDAFKEAVRMKPEFAIAHYGLAIAYENSGQYEEAIASWTALLDLGEQGGLREKAEKSLERLRGL
jgi:Tfp pilus assembly protein PilF